MASKKKDNGAKDEDFSLPDGFKRVTSLRPDGYFSPGNGLICQGVLLGRFKRHDKKRDKDEFFYQVRLTMPIGAKDADGKAINLEPGKILQIDERMALTDLQSWVSKEGGPWEVFIRVREKLDLDGGKTFWPMDIGAKAATV